jgi:hypothetical protein
MEIEEQHQIGRTLAQPENLEEVRRLLAQASDGVGPVGVARAVCDRFAFRSPSGEAQVGTCLDALRRLERGGHLVLPASTRTSGGLVRPVRLGHPVEEPRDVPDRVDQINDLSLILVESKGDRAIWNELVIGEHPLGANPLVGRRLLYLVRSGHGYLGALGFSSCALKLQCREVWIGWDDEVRRRYLERVVALSRFLIRPCVRCDHLASRVLGLAVKRVGSDYRDRYGVEIFLLETFVDPTKYDGTCFRAANWIGIGQSKGRGRQDIKCEAQAGIKDVYMYPLESRFRQILKVEKRLPPLGVAEGLEGSGWARQEFAGAQVGHVGRVERVIQMAEGKGRKPNATWLEVAEGDRQQLKGIYRFVDQPDESQVTMEGILKGHKERTKQRMAAEAVVLCLQDSTDLNFSDLLECEGLGFVGKNKTTAVARGLRLHASLVVTKEGIPLGILHADCEARQELEQDEKGRDSRKVPIEEKESYRWLRSVEACIDASKSMPNTMIVNVADREADIFDLFDRVRNEPRVHLLVRARNDRRMGPDGHLFEQVRATEERGQVEVTVPRQSARRKEGKRQAQEKSPSRCAKLALRYMACRIYPPKHGTNARKKPVPASIIYLKEKDAQKDVEPIEWYLLTTVTVNSFENAVMVLKWYPLRWRIEDFNRVLKSGCETEAHAHRTAERLKRAIAIDLVVAYRIMMMVLLGRESPELPAEVLFSDVELRVLSEWNQKKNPHATPLKTIGPTLHVLGALGGHLGRKSDPPVGPKILQRACTRLRDMCEGYILANPDLRPEEEPGHG